MITATSSISVFSAWSRASSNIAQRGQIKRKPHADGVAVSSPPSHGWPWLIVLTVVSLLTASVSAFADSSNDPQVWQRCVDESSGTLWFDSTSVSWLDSTTLHYSVTIGADCGRQTYVQIIEGTRQSNDNPQKLGPGYIPGPGTFSGSQVVTPLRSLTWFMYLGDPNFGDVPTPLKLPSNDHRSLGAVIEVTYPAGPLLDPAHSSLVVTGNTFTVTDNSVAQRRDFVRAVETPNAVVRVMGNVDLDLSGLDRIRLEPNVQIIGDRSLNPVGPRLFTTTEPSYLFVVPQTRSDSHERISWIRLQGGSSTDPFDNTGDEDSDGILVAKPNVEIDHNEIYLWKGAGVSVMDCDDYVDCDPQRKQMNRGNAAAVWIHDNFIHHDQHPSAGFGGGHTGGYGVETTHGAYALVERNVFDYNRHSISSGGQVGTGYLFYRNLILPNGGVHAHLVATHAIDVHGSNGSALESGHAGEYFDVEYNTVWYTTGHGVKLRGTPTDPSGAPTDPGMEVRHNVFAHCGLWALPANQSCFGVQALVQNETGLNESDNHINAKVGGATATTCDFDGDGINDTFHATGVTWWYESSVLRGRYVYLNQSTATSVTLGDRNGDGMCDVDIGGSVFYSPRNSSTGTALALHGGDNFLWRIVNGIGGWAGNGLSVAPGTSPAIASDGHGHWKIAFHALGNHLWTMDSTGALVNTGLPMASGANSPAIAALATGGYEIAFVGSDGYLWKLNPTYSDARWAGAGLSVAPGTSPAMAADGSGGWKIAFHALGDHLWTIDSADRPVDTGLPMASGANSRVIAIDDWLYIRLPMASGANSPAIAALATGGYEIAFVGSDGYLWKLNPTYSDARWAGAGLSVAPGTSPAMAADGSGGWKIAFHALGDHLWTIDSADRPVDTGILLSKDHNSPAIAALPYFGYDIAYKNAADGLLWEVGPFGERYMSANGLGLAPDTSSSITAM